MCLPGTAEIVRDRAENDGIPRLDRRTVLLGAAGAALAGVFPNAAEADGGRGKRIVDLTHVFREGFPVFVGAEPTREDLNTFATSGFYAQKWAFGEHSGTHMDAPGHFVPGGRLTPDITPQELMVPLVVVDISAKAARNPDALVTRADLRRFERRHGRIPDRAFVAMDSGWWRKIDDELAFKGGPAFPNYHFPGWSAGAVDWLLDKREITGVGVDTMSLDPGNSTTFDVHLLLLGANRYGIENLTNLSSVRRRGATLFVGVVPWEEGSGGPLRALAIR